MGQQRTLLFHARRILRGPSLGKMFPGPFPVPGRIEQHPQILGRRLEIAGNEIGLRQAAEIAGAGVRRGEQHAQHRVPFRHRHIPQGEPDVAGTADLEGRGLLPYREEKPPFERLVIVHQAVGKLPAVGVGQVVIVSTDEGSVVFGGQFGHLVPVLKRSFDR